MLQGSLFLTFCLLLLNHHWKVVLAKVIKFFLVKFLGWLNTIVDTAELERITDEEAWDLGPDLPWCSNKSGERIDSVLSTKALLLDRNCCEAIDKQGKHINIVMSSNSPSYYNYNEDFALYCLGLQMLIINLSWFTMVQIEKC